MKRLLAILGVLLLAPAWAQAPDLEREQRMTEQYAEAVLDGEVVELQAGEHAFMAIFTEADEPKGTVVILHGRGFHPDWPKLIQPLRVGLVEHGWNTLSIQLPILPKAAKYYDYAEIFPSAIPRIEAALEYVRETAPEGKLVMLAHSCGSHMAQYWMNQKGEAAYGQLDGYIGIGMGATDYRQQMIEPFGLEHIQTPVLDIFGGADYPAVRRLAPVRGELINRAGNPKSAQIVIPSANHYYDGQTPQLIEQLAAWLDKL